MNEETIADPSEDREAFEAVGHDYIGQFNKRGATYANGWRYSDGHIQMCWLVWQAGRRAERERCAKIAERDGSSHSATFAQQTPEWHARVNSEVRTADRIAAAIRKPRTP